MRLRILILLFVFLLSITITQSVAYSAGLHQEEFCAGQFTSLGKPLNDLGHGEYVRPQSGPTGFTGGLYPNGRNIRPFAHNIAGLEMAEQVVPRNQNGDPDPNGKIVLISVGMSNTAREFATFANNVKLDSSLNPHLSVINGARGGRVAIYWTDPQAETWEYVDGLLAYSGLTPQQVQVAWVKLTNYDLIEFPQSAQKLQADLETIARNLKIRYPNIKIAYYSSRTRSYLYWRGLNPEPGAFETGFSVKWMVEKQINGDVSLNYDPRRGQVVAPYIAWGPYLWIDGLNPRSDGLVWLPEDLTKDCVHPSTNGKEKVAQQLMDFLKTDETARTWFLKDAPPASDNFNYFPLVRIGSANPVIYRAIVWRYLYPTPGTK
jgi:hypothetical protein